MSDKPINIEFFSKVLDFLQSSRHQVLQMVNRTMVSTYFEIGRMIVEEQQDGEARAIYGKGLLKELSKVLKEEFGKGFSADNLENMRRFYLIYENPRQCLGFQYHRFPRHCLGNRRGNHLSLVFPTM